jgi:RNA polymerase sigma-70 factor (ECF subfamily)
MNSSSADAELVRKVAAGNSEALMQLYLRYGGPVFSVAFYIVRDRAAAEEIAQDTFMTLWRKAGQFDDARGRVGPWLLQITRNLAIDRLRYQRRRVQSAAPLEVAESMAATSDGLAAEDQRNELHKLLQQLPEAQRQAIELAYFQGFTHDQIAAKLGLPVGTVKSRILLGLRKLHALLK